MCIGYRGVRERESVSGTEGLERESVCIWHRGVRERESAWHKEKGHPKKGLSELTRH